MVVHGEHAAAGPIVAPRCFPAARLGIQDLGLCDHVNDIRRETAGPVAHFRRGPPPRSGQGVLEGNGAIVVSGTDLSLTRRFRTPHASRSRAEKAVGSGRGRRHSLQAFPVGSGDPTPGRQDRSSQSARQWSPAPGSDEHAGAVADAPEATTGSSITEHTDRNSGIVPMSTMSALPRSRVIAYRSNRCRQRRAPRQPPFVTINSLKCRSTIAYRSCARPVHGVGRAREWTNRSDSAV